MHTQHHHTPLHNRQRGGTLVGIIIGLVVGLAIALGVAMVITKTPVPFTNKMGKQEKSNGPSAAQSADPNKPLYGNRAAAKEAAKTFVKEPVVTLPADAAADKKAEAKAETKPQAKADNKVAAVDPIAEAAKKAELKTSDARKPETAGEAADDKWSYYLQAGAFREQADAENTRAKLALMGVEARISERQSETGVLYRVRVGPFAQLEPANRVRGKLSDNGVDAAVVRISK